MKTNDEIFTMDYFDLVRYSRETTKIEARMTQAANSRFAMASWDPNANLSCKLAERATKKGVR